MRYLIGWVLILHAVHFPIPFPDLDGECRGTPIHSLAEPHAWHVVLLGIRPNDEIDRGPIRTNEAGQESSTESVLGGYAFITARVVAPAEFPMLVVSLNMGLQIPAAKLLSCEFGESNSPPASPLARDSCIAFCRWQI